MAFFQTSVVNKHLKTLDKATIAAAYARFKAHFHNTAIQENIRNSKEEQYQGEFLIDLFVNVLGYTKNPTPNYNLTTEHKNVKDSKKADGAILINDAVKAVIELKGTNTTDLGKIEEQAFGYKNNQPGCVYVVTSNFEKLRFYIDNAVEHLEFNLFSLSEKDFALLYLCLAHESIANGTPKKIKDESVSQEDVITKQLYKDYSLFKRELHQSLVGLNPQFEPLELFKKSQKLLDRFLFLFFAEDRQLLPPNSVRLILDQWRTLQDLDVEIPLYDRFKLYFGYLNTGHKGKQYDVFAYNGGLFKADDILDNITVDDELLYKHALKLSEYDFASEVDVNILGHIFENSLNELDEIKAQLEGQTIDKASTKRKKDGVFYTPKYITKYIVENTVGKLCAEKKAELQLNDEDYTTDKKRQLKTRKVLDDKLKAYREWLLQLTICDPACGSGAFLNQALDFLITEHRYIDELQAKLMGYSIVLSDVEKSILENNLFGVDLNEESVEIAKLSLWLRTAQPNRKLNDLNNNIKCGNSLIDDPTVAGDKAFNWQQAFPQVFEKGGFDVVIGNPPYVRQELIKQYYPFLQKNYKVFSGKSDLYTYFFEKAHEILKQDGFLSFISSGKFFEASYGKILVEFLTANFKIDEIIDFDDLDIFKGISAYPLIFTGIKTKTNKYRFKYCFAPDTNTSTLDEITTNLKFDKIEVEDFIKNDYKFFSSSVSALIQKINCNGKSLSSIGCSPLVGVKSGFNEGFITKRETDTYVKPFLFGKNIKKYSTPVIEANVVFPYFKENESYSLIKESELGDLREDLLSNRKKLESRAIINDGIKTGTKAWYEYQQINKKVDFDSEYIVYPNVSLGPNFTLISGSVIDITCFVIPSNNKYLLTILNSKLTGYLMENFAISRRGGYQEFKVQYLEKIPIIEISKEAQQPFIEKADTMLSLNEALQSINQKFQRTLGRKFGLTELPKKLQDWYLLPYGEFIKELAKKKVKLSLADEAEWEDYFTQEAQKALSLKNQIAATDAEIDQLVYQLYNLTNEEIAIVEG